MPIGPNEVNLVHFEIASAVSPGGTVPISYEIDFNPNIDFTVFDKDYCQAGPFPGDHGGQVDVLVFLNGNFIKAQQHCLDHDDVKTHTLSFPAPGEAGQYEVLWVVQSRTTSEELLSKELILMVDEDMEPDTCPKGYEKDPETGSCVPIGSDNGDNGGGGDGESLLEWLQGEGTLLLLLFFLAIIIKSGSEIFD